MAQVKVYGNREALDPIKARLSDVIHGCVVETLQLPAEKRFHRFFPLDPSDFIYPADRSSRYTIVEISMMEGRSVETKKRLIRLLFARISQQFDIPVADIEVTISESPKHCWGFRGLPGDEIGLTYTVEV